MATTTMTVLVVDDDVVAAGSVGFDKGSMLFVMFKEGEDRNCMSLEIASHCFLFVTTSWCSRLKQMD